jgi:hypothetical protein
MTRRLTRRRLAALARAQRGITEVGGDVPAGSCREIDVAEGTSLVRETDPKVVEGSCRQSLKVSGISPRATGA